MLIALLCESEMKLADETIEVILDKVSIYCCWYYMLVLIKNWNVLLSTIHYEAGT